MSIKKKNVPPYYEYEGTKKVYIALLNQTGSENPSAIELKNEIGVITWNREGTGSYSAEITGEDFVYTKTLVWCSQQNTSAGKIARGAYWMDGKIIVSQVTFGAPNTQVDELVDVQIKIETYS